VDKSEAAAIKRWLPGYTEVTIVYIDTEESFPDGLAKDEFTHVIHSGSSLTITETAPFTKKAVSFIRRMWDRGSWQFGICYGHQLICLALLGKHTVRSSLNGFEVGWKEVKFTNHGMNILGVGDCETIWQSHFDEVAELPEGSELSIQSLTRKRGISSFLKTGNLSGETITISMKS
jgi:GMP synthase (glutamine-hydrolysing)